MGAVEKADRLETLERIIERSVRAAGEALMEIKSKGLYEEHYDTFEDYCQQRWGWTPDYARKYIRAARVTKRIEESTNKTMVSILPENERQARPLTSLPPEKQAGAWQVVVETAPTDKQGEREITSSHVKETVDRIRGKDGRHPRSPKKKTVDYKVRDLVGVLVTLDEMPSDAELEALDANPMMIEKLRSARQLIDRILAIHTSEPGDERS